MNIAFSQKVFNNIWQSTSIGIFASNIFDLTDRSLYKVSDEDGCLRCIL